MSENNRTVEQASEELETAAYNGVSKIFGYLTSFYGEYFATDEDLNRVFVKILTNMLGDMLAHFPDDQKSEVVDWAFENVEYIRTITENDILLDRSVEGEAKDETKTSLPDLARMIPKGNC